MQQKKLIFILPNLFTASSIFAGVISLTEASQEHFVRAAWMILLSLLFDGMDGRIARLTHTTSRFGIEFDSLADIVSFGVAPAVLIYFYIGSAYGKFGVLVSALYVIFGAIRLARFNVTTQHNDPNIFIGLPIPIAAVFLASSILFFQEYDIRDYGLVLLVFALAAALLMVSNFRYPSFKTVNLERQNIYKVLVTVTTAASLLYVFSAEGFTLIVLSYIIYGPIRAINPRKFRLNKK
jgi:CDP-diacylglycerol--serine O-phosphatidyltransferase